MEGANSIAALSSNIDSLGANFTAATYGVFAYYLTPVMAALFTLYLIFWGFRFWQGQGGSIVGMVFKLVRIAIIFSLVTAWGPFQVALYGLFTNAPYMVSSVMLNHIVNPRSGKAMGFSTLANDLNASLRFRANCVGQNRAVSSRGCRPPASTGSGRRHLAEPGKIKPDCANKKSRGKSADSSIEFIGAGSNRVDCRSLVRWLRGCTPLVCKSCVVDHACARSIFHRVADVPNPVTVLFRLAHGHDPDNPDTDLSDNLPQFLQYRYTGCGEGAGVKPCKGQYTCHEGCRSFCARLPDGILLASPDRTSQRPNCDKQPGMVHQSCVSRGQCQQKHRQFHGCRTRRPKFLWKHFNRFCARTTFARTYGRNEPARGARQKCGG